MKDIYNPIGIFKLDADDRKKLDALVRQTAIKGPSAKREFELMGQRMAAPIRQVAPYVSWTERFFVPDPVGAGEDNRVPLDEYTTVAFYSSPTGQVMYTRPGRKYERPDFTMIDCGIEVGWDTMAEAGWDVLARKQKEATEELARKRDSLAQTVLNSAVTASGNTTSVAGGSMTKAAVDAIFKSQAGSGWKIQTVVGNPQDLMDMTDWSAANNLWLWPDDMARDLVTMFYWANYGGANWYAYHTAPSGYVYFSVAPDQVGYHQTKGDIRTASDIDIDKKTNKYTWDEKDAYIVCNDYGLYRLQITA